MVELLLKGVVTGLILSVMVGPVFFVLLETSIRRGIRAALAIDFGVFLSDIFYILIAFFFYSEVEELSSGSDNSTIRLIGGIIFIIFGVFNFFKKPSASDSGGNLTVSQSKGKDYVFLVLKGFLLNLANPLVVFYWFSVISYGAADAEANSNLQIIIFLSVILITFFGIDALKIFGAKRLRPLVTKKLLVGLNRLIGIVFVAFGLFLIFQKYVKV